MPMLDTKISEVPAISKILLGVIIGLAIAGFIYALIVKNEGPKATTLTAEQQARNDLQEPMIGDIVEVSIGFQGIKTSHWMIKGKDPEQHGTFMSPITQNGYIGMSKYVSWHEFVEENPRVIPIHDEEWALILRLYMGPDNANSYSLAPE